MFEPSLRPINDNNSISLLSSSSNNNSRGSGCGRVASASSITKMKESHINWLGTVDQLVIDNAYLMHLKPLIMDLSALRLVSFKNNRLNNLCLSDLGQYCPNLEEISLENNHLNSLIHLWYHSQTDENNEKEENEPINNTGRHLTHHHHHPNSNMNRHSQRVDGWFRHLKKFDCGHNNLTNLGDLNNSNGNGGNGNGNSSGGGGMVVPLNGYGLDRLTQLSLESNHISSLHSIRSLVGLMELYMGNNDISELAEIDHLKVSVYKVYI